ncbi:MAG: TonB family protein [Verrucomicrobiales bacterium]
MTLTKLKPFGARRKTYFYGVAGFVLAGHVVVGAIFHVMPPEFDEPGTIVPVEVQIVDHLLPDEVVESSAVRIVEESAPEEEEAPVFVPVWEPSPIAPELEPLGPTETVLPEVVLDEGAAEPVVEDPTPAVVTEIPVPVKETTPPPERRKKPEPKSNTPPVKKNRPEPRKVESTPPKERPSAAEARPVAPPEPEIERAIPVAPRTGGRTGMLNRLRNKSDTRPRTRSDSRTRNEPCVAASWSKRPPPYYPYEARKRGIEGTAHVRVSIDSSGRITAARLSKSSGDKLLDQAAMASVRKGVLKPARRGGRSVSSEMLVPFEFYLP